MKSLICGLKKIIWLVVPDKFMYYVYVDYKCNSHYSIFEMIFSIKSFNIFFNIYKDLKNDKILKILVQALFIIISEFII